jgi:4-hydroxy-tetrahydrodipicolinate synthase
MASDSASPEGVPASAPDAFAGCFTALVTPFRGGAVDVAALRALVDRQVRGGVRGVVPCGTTGESPTLAPAEFDTVVGTVVEQAAGRLTVIAGTGSNDTAASVRRTRRARELGADGALVVVPYYNKPTQEGLYRHFRAVIDGGGLPVVLYDVPPRTVTSLQVPTIVRIVEGGGVVAIKDATGDLGRMTELVARFGPTLHVLSGDDPLTLPVLAVGGRGVVSVTSNVVPDLVADLVHAAGRDGDLARARQRHLELRRLNAALFLESNPVPVKAALAMMGLIDEEPRLPLAPLSDHHRPTLRAALAELGLV